MNLQHAEQLLRGVLIPPRPQLLVELLNEQGKPDPDLRRISNLIRTDVALAAGTLKVVNSPYYGLTRRISSVDHAVRLMGLRNVSNLVTGLMLHSAFQGDGGGSFLEFYFEHAHRLAQAATLVARRSGALDVDEAYTLGLLADSGMPLMLRRFPNYPSIFRRSVQAQDKPSTHEEAEYLGTDHTFAGFMVVRSWKLPGAFCQAVLRHHDTVDYYGDDEPDAFVPGLAVLMVAREVERRRSNMPESYVWQAIGEQACAYLGLRADDVDALVDEARRSEVADG